MTLRQELLDTLKYIKDERIAAENYPETTIAFLIKGAFLDAGVTIDERIEIVLLDIVANCLKPIELVEFGGQLVISDPVEDCETRLRLALAEYI
jgi:hypothetical protein